MTDITTMDELLRDAPSNWGNGARTTKWAR